MNLYTKRDIDKPRKLIEKQGEAFREAFIFAQSMVKDKEIEKNYDSDEFSLASSDEYMCESMDYNSDEEALDMKQPLETLSSVKPSVRSAWSSSSVKTPHSDITEATKKVQAEEIAPLDNQFISASSLTNSTSSLFTSTNALMKIKMSRYQQQQFDDKYPLNTKPSSFLPVLRPVQRVSPTVSAYSRSATPVNSIASSSLNGSSSSLFPSITTTESRDYGTRSSISSSLGSSLSTPSSLFASVTPTNIRRSAGEYIDSLDGSRKTDTPRMLAAPFALSRSKPPLSPILRNNDMQVNCLEELESVHTLEAPRRL